MTGQKIGKLTILYRTENDKYGKAMWHCQCECGNEKDILGASLRNGTTSCGKCNRKSQNKWNLDGEYGIGYDNQDREFYFDKEDFNLIKDYYWRVHYHNYVSTAIWDSDNQKVHQIQLHRFIMNPTNEQEVDHINHIPYDNRKENLRVVSTAQNQMNTVVNIRNTSGVKGVNWDKIENKWYARISVNGKRISIGYFNSLEEAAQARKAAEIKYYGEFRYQEGATMN